MPRLLALALLLAAAMAASADAGLDLAILIDRSTSMASRPRSDTVLLRMTLDLVARNAAANRVGHRFAVIGFGSSVTIEIPFTTVHDYPAASLRARIDALQRVDRGDTDVLAALVVADRLFRALPASPDRRRAVLLLTDGVPYVRGENMTAYRENLERFKAAHFTGQDISVDVLLAGREPERLLPEAHGVIARLIGTRAVESAPAKADPAVDMLVVPPYLDMIVFDIVRGSGGATVEVYPPGSAAPVRGGAGGVESMRLGDVLVTLAVPRPPPGEWMIRKSRGDARVRILSQQFFPRGLLVRPADSDAPARCDHVSLAYRVLDGSGRPFEELREYLLALDVTLAKPGGSSTTVTMERDPALGPGVFRSTKELLCELPGRYWTDVRITTVDAAGRRLDVFRDRWSGFSVVAAGNGDCRTLPVARKVRANGIAEDRWVLPLLVVGAIAAAAAIWRKTETRS